METRRPRTFPMLNLDPEGMEYFPKILSLKESNELTGKIINFITENGWGLWVVTILLKPGKNA